MNQYIILAILSSLLAPVFYYLIPEKTKTSSFIDGMTVTTLVCLVALHIVPESLEYSGYLTISAVIIGLIGPLLFSKLSRKNECEIQRPFLLFTLLGFIAHNVLDGTALVMHPDNPKSTHLLALAVVLHRLIVSIALWRTFARDFGFFRSFLALIGLSSSMVFGYFFSDMIFTNMEAGILHLLQSLSCGMLFHVILHPHHIKEILQQAKSPDFLLKSQSLGAGLGIILAVITYLYWPHNHEHHSHGHHHHEETVK